jgi:hypothetical protein
LLQLVLVVTLSELKSADFFDLCIHIVNGVPQPPAQKLSVRPWSFVAIGITPGGRVRPMPVAKKLQGLDRSCSNNLKVNFVPEEMVEFPSK